MTGWVQRRVRITGRVQGVWYRGWTVKTASNLGLDGWVRNRSGGDVEAVFAGPAESVASMLVACRSGPPAARVDSIDVAPDSETMAPGFHQRPTH